MTILLPASLGWAAPLIMAAPFVLARCLLAYAVGYFARCRGYGFWEFFWGAALLDPLACALLLLVVPKLEGNCVAAGRGLRRATQSGRALGERR